MSFFQKLFGKKKFYAKDNLGTRYDTEDKATNAWNVQGMSVSEGSNVNLHFTSGQGAVNAQITAKGYPYFCYRFATQEQAETAFAALPFIQKAEDSGEFISTKVLEYGCFGIDEGEWEIIAWGADLTRSAPQAIISHSPSSK